MIRCVVFDFDGTLVDSNYIKHSTFFEVAAHFVNGREVMSRIMDAPDPGTRHEVFDKFVAQIETNPDSRAQLGADLAKRYSELCHREVSCAPEIPGVSKILRKLASTGIRMFISSATPNEPLIDLVQARGLKDFMDGVFGAPESKVGHISQIRKLMSLSPREIMYVGDSEVDQQAAEAAQCCFVGLQITEGRFAAQPERTMNTLMELPAIIEEFNASDIGRGEE